jgi:transposase
MQITTIGLDIAKNVFQVHGIDASEKVFVRKQLRRSQHECGRDRGGEFTTMPCARR